MSFGTQPPELQNVIIVKIDHVIFAENVAKLADVSCTYACIARSNSANSQEALPKLNQTGEFLADHKTVSASSQVSKCGWKSVAEHS